MTNIDRRLLFKLLGGSAAASGLADLPLSALLEAMTMRALSTAHAAEGPGPRRWFDFRLNSAPPRWAYDLFLTPYGTSGFVESPAVGTKFAGTNVYTDIEYSTVNYDIQSKRIADPVVGRAGMLVPWIWSTTVPKPGGWRPMSDLLANMLQLRGVNSGNPGHSGAQQLHFRPLGAIQTLSALSADLSDAPVPAVAATSFFRFGSRANKSAVLLTANNLLEELMVPLVLSGSTSAASRRNAMKNYMQAVRTSINRDLRASSDFFNGSIASQNAAFEMFSRSFGDLSKTWTQLLAKYDSLIKRAIDPSREVIGLNDKPIGVSGTRNATYNHDGVRVANEDLLTMFDAKTNIDSMARAFALAEFIARNDISYSVSIGIGGIQDLLMGTSRKNFNVDEHFTGSMVSLLISSYMARATSACLLAFIDVLKELNIFDDTVINISGEFNRKPRADGSGSDHNWEGANLNFYSGAITRPRVLGNIAANNDTNYPGTYGLGAPVTELGGIQLDLGHVAASVATLLRAPSPVTARTTLLEESSGVVTPLSSVPNGKIV